MITPVPAEDLDRILEAASETALVVIGGQAISYWVARFGLGPPPVTGDVDFYSARSDDPKEVAHHLNLPLHEAELDDVTPSAASIEYSDSRGETRVVDFLHNVYGVHRVRFVAACGRKNEALRILHPIDCVHSKFHNLTLPDYRTRARLPLALEQARLSVSVASAFCQELLREESDGTAARAVRRHAKELFHLGKSVAGTQVYREYQLDPFDAIRPWPGTDPDFRERSYPRWREKLSSVQARSQR